MKIIAFVGMPGSGKTEAADVARNLKFPVIRLGDLTDEELKKRGLEINEQNERKIREDLRKEFGMDIYAKRASERAEQINAEKTVVLDGVKSFEEFLFLKNKYGKNFVSVCTTASPATRHKRLGQRKIRPLNELECRSRDLSELKNLNEGATIAMADCYILNEKLKKIGFQGKIGALLRKLSQQKA